MQTDISNRTIDLARSAAELEQKRIYLRDQTLKGFVALITPKGSISFLVEYRHGGKQHRIKIGRLGPLTAKEAREEARQALARAHSGENVTAPKSHSTTFAEALDMYLERAGKGKRTWKEVERIMKYDALPAWKNTPVSEIRHHHVAQLIDEVQQRTQSGARILFANLRPMFRWLVERNLIEQNPTSDLKAPAAQKSRDRVLTDKELKQVWNACTLDWWPFGPIFRLLILTGARENEVAGMSIDELQGDEWIISAERTKNGIEHVVHLSPLAMETLAAYPPAGDLVFSTTGYSAPSGFSKAKRRIDQELPDIPHWRIHDLRRTFSSGLARLGVEPHITERCINHLTGSQSGVQGTYQRYRYMDDRKAAFNRWGAHIQKLVGGEHAE